MANNKNKKENIVPNGLAWFIYATAAKLYFTFKNKVTINKKDFRKRNKKEACLIIYNHASNKDHFLTTRALGYTKTAYVVSSHFFYNKTIGTVLKWVKAISKEQFKSDIGTIKKIKRALQKKVPVAIAPAGQITMHGDPLTIDKSIVKLVRMCNVDLYAISLHGAYLAYPKWRKFRRKLPIHIDFVKVLNKEDFALLSDDELYKVIVDSITVNDRKEVDKYHYNLKKEGLVEGIEDMLYRCPKCNGKNTLQSTNNILTCNVCKNTVFMNNRGLFEGAHSNSVVMRTEAVWYEWQKNQIVRDVENNELYLEGEFDLLCDTTQSFELKMVGSGKLVLTNDELYYLGTNDGKTIRKDFKLSSLSQIPFETRHHLAIPDEEGTFEFLPSITERSSKIAEFVQTIEVLAARRK